MKLSIYNLRFAIVALLLVAMVSPLKAALNANTVFEIRTTGGNDHGGGFVTGASGTDYSQQADPQYDITNGDATGVGAVMTTATAAANMVGNIGYLVGGTHCTVGWYEILSVVAGVSITLDRNFISDVGHTDVHFHIGGAFLLGGALDDEFTEALVAGNTVYVKTGTYTAAEAVAQAVDGTALAPITWIGYTAARNDATVGTNRPLFDFTSYNLTFGDYTIAKNIRFTPALTNGICGGFYGTFINCKFTNSSGTAGRFAFYSLTSKLISCEFVSTNGIGIYAEGPDAIVNCYVHDSVTGIQSTSSSVKIIGNVIDTCTTGISYTAAAPVSHVVMQNTVYNCPTGISGGVCASSSFINNIITACTTGASWTTEQKINFWDYNCWNNGAGDVSNVTKGPHDITVDPLLTDPANGDFTLQAGSPCLDTGAQMGTDQGAVGDYKVNIGIDQDDNAAPAGGGGVAGYMGNF